MGLSQAPPRGRAGVGGRCPPRFVVVVAAAPGGDQREAGHKRQEEDEPQSARLDSVALNENLLTTLASSLNDPAALTGAA